MTKSTKSPSFVGSLWNLYSIHFWKFEKLLLVSLEVKQFQISSKISSTDSQSSPNKEANGEINETNFIDIASSIFSVSFSLPYVSLLESVREDFR